MNVLHNRVSPWLRTLLILSSLLLVGLHPFAYTSLATSFDGLLHLYRLVELDHLITQGIWFSRWAPDFVFGFGYPIFNFYAPLAYYLTAPLHWLGFSFVDSATIFFVACTLAASVGMFAFMRAAFAHDSAALVAALAYAYAPTHIYDNFYRSAWGTVLAYAIVPIALWAMLRWQQAHRWHFLIALAMSIAALMLAHNVTALLAMPLIVCAAFVFGLSERSAVKSEPSARHRTRLTHRLSVFTAHSSLFIVLGIALSACFWLPALVETQFVQTWRLTIPPDFDFREHFLSLLDWIAWPAPAEVGRINPDLVNTLGPVHVLLALDGLISLAALRGVQRRITIFFGVVLIASLYMTLPQSAWLWEHISILPSLQFPHRFLTISALCAAVLSAACISAIPVRWQQPATMSACALLIVGAIPFLYPRSLPPVTPNPTLADVLAHEHESGALGTTASGEYFPMWVQFIPKSSTFEDAIVNGENPQRFDSRSLPSGGNVLWQQASALSFTLRVQSPRDFRATFRQFYFPGWQAFVDGQPVAVEPNVGQGLATFAVPMGEHTIALTFTSTPIRDFAQIMSILALVLCIVVVLLYVVLRQRTQPNIADVAVNFRPSLSYLLLGIILLTFKMTIADNFDTPLRQNFDGARVPQVKYARFESLSGTLDWLGYDLPNDSAQPEQTLALTLYWSAQHTLNTVYSSFAHIVDEHANLYAQKDNLHPGGAPTTTWRAREYDVDRHTIVIPAGTPPGDYWIEIGMYDPHHGARLLRDDANGAEPADRFILGPIHVRKPTQPAPTSALHIQHALARQWQSGLTMLGYTLERERLPSDDFLRVALFWRADAEILPALAMRMRLLDAQQNEISSQHGAPSNDRYATTQWSAGELVRDNRALWIPPNLPNGDYRLQLQVDGDGEWIDLGVVSK